MRRLKSVLLTLAVVLVATDCLAGYEVIFSSQDELFVGSISPGSLAQQATSIPDFDGDGAPELLAFSADQHTLYVVDAASGFVEYTQQATPGHGIGAAPFDVDGDGRLDIVVTDGVSVKYVSFLGVASVPEPGPQSEILGAIAPNPFSTESVLRVRLASKQDIRVDVYDPAGRLIRTLVDGVKDAGVLSVVWDGMLTAGRPAASGVYFLRAEASGRPLGARKVVLAR